MPGRTAHEIARPLPQPRPEGSRERCFDRYVVVDWSASATPTTGADSIWVAVLGTDGRDPVLANPATRLEAETLLRAACDARHRTLIAVDAPLGYSAGAAEHFGVGRTGDRWRGMWEFVAGSLVDGPDNVNNRFAIAADLNRRGGSPRGPFWGRPAARQIDGLETTKPRPFTPGIAEFRRCERWLRRLGLRPSSCWQLLGAGSVGSQTLTLLPVLDRLLADSASGRRVEIWPFTTGWVAPHIDPGGVVVAETWPTAFDVDRRADWIRDASQVNDVAVALRCADDAGSLAEWFDPPAELADEPDAADVGDATLDEVVADVVVEEGWALVPRERDRAGTH